MPPVDLRAKEIPRHMEEQLMWDDYPPELMQEPACGRVRTVKAKFEAKTMTGKTRSKEAFKDLWMAILRDSNSDGLGDFDLRTTAHRLPREVPQIQQDPNLRRYSFTLEAISCQEAGKEQKLTPPEMEQKLEEVERRREHFEKLNKEDWPDQDVPGGPLDMSKMRMTLEEVERSLQSGSTGARPRRRVLPRPRQIHPQFDEEQGSSSSVQRPSHGGIRANFHRAGANQKRRLSDSDGKPDSKTQRSQETPASVRRLKERNLVTHNIWSSVRQQKITDYGLKKLTDEPDDPIEDAATKAGVDEEDDTDEDADNSGLYNSFASSMDNSSNNNEAS